MDVALSTVQWVVGKAVAPVADGVLEAWEASKNLGLHIEALKTELLLVKATLDTASRKEIGGPAVEQLLQKLRDSAHSAEDLLDELDYFRINDQLHGTYDAADQHGKLACLSSPADPGQEDEREQTSCCAWPRVKHRRGNPSFAPDSNQANEEVRGCMPKLGKVFPRSSSPDVVNDGETPRLGFNRVDVSERMKQIIEELQPVRREVTTILQSCGPNTVRAIAQNRPITTSQSIEPKLYGRDHVVNSIIHDITKGKYCGKDLSVLPIVGPGGIGKTTLIQHICENQEVKNHFPVRIWVCVSLSFDLNKLLEEIKRQSPQVDPEEKEGTTEQLIEQRLKSRRFLLVLDDIWLHSNKVEWERLLLLLKQSQEKGSMILITTRSPGIAKMVRTTDHSIELRGLKSEDFRELFHALVFGHKQSRRDQTNLLHTGDMIIEKLKGFPLAAKTVGKLLREDHNLHHWRRVLESKEWERQIGVDDIMPALKRSYDFLPFELQQCFFYSALFPEDYKYSSSQLIDLWSGLNILHLSDQNQTFQEKGLINLNDLVTHGFFREEETNGRLCYVMHDLLHSLALKVASSHDCISLHTSNIGSAETHPSIRHLSIIIDDIGDRSDVSCEDFKSELRKLRKRLRIDHLHTLMLFGDIDGSFAYMLSDLFMEANALRVLYLPRLLCPVESILYNFSELLHLRYLCLGTKYPCQMHLPLAISRFYHLRILDLKSWHGLCDFPKGLSNLINLRHFHTPRDELHSDICNVGKLVLLEELKVFRVNKERKGFETNQLEHMTELRELGIYNLENIQTEEASEANVISKKYLERLTLDWDSKRSNIEPNMEADILDKLRPHGNLKVLCIRGHGGPSCPSWLDDKLVCGALQSLHLSCVSWECLPYLGKMWTLGDIILKHLAKIKEFVIEQNFYMLVRLELVGLESFEKWVQAGDDHLFPHLQVLIILDCPNLLELPFSNHIGEKDWNMDWLPRLQELEIDGCPEVLIIPHIPWTETLHRVNIRGVKPLENLVYLRSSNRVGLEIIGKDGLRSLEQVLAFSNLKEVEELRLEKCPHLELKHLSMLTSLKKLVAEGSDCLVGPLGGQGDMQWQLPVEHLVVHELCGASGKELTELVNHLPKLSKLEIIKCKNITQLCVEVVLQKTTSTASKSIAAGSEMEEAAAASESEDDGVLLIPVHLRDSLRELSILRCPELVLDAQKTGGLQALRSLQMIQIEESPKFLSAYSVYSRLFPSFLQILELDGVEGMGTLEPLSYLTSLTRLQLWNCGEDLRCEGLQPLLTIGGQLRALEVFGSPKFFAGWSPNARRVQLVCKLGKLRTDDAVGLLVVPICSLMSSSLTELTFGGIKEMERFLKKQEEALHCLSSLEVLEFRRCNKLQHLPAELYKLTNLKILSVIECPAVRSLPKDGLPKSLQKLDVCICGNEELINQCRVLVGTIPEIILE